MAIMHISRWRDSFSCLMSEDKSMYVCITKPYRGVLFLCLCVCVYRLVRSSGRLEEFISLSLGFWGPKCPGLRNPEFPDIIRKQVLTILEL